MGFCELYGEFVRCAISTKLSYVLESDQVNIVKRNRLEMGI